MGAKLSKPSLDTIGGWLEGRITKIITGDADTPPAQVQEFSKPDEQTFGGFSTISSTTTSASPSPQPSVINLNVLPPHRTGSAMASSSPYAPYSQIDRASSAMDYTKRRASPGPRIASAGAATTTFSQSTSFGQAMHDYSPPTNGYQSNTDLLTPRPSMNHNEDDETGQDATWWGASSYDESSTAQTPTASSFLRVDDAALAPSSDGFISLMDNNTYSVAPSSPLRHSSRPAADEDDEEDLGFGNSRPGSRVQGSSAATQSEKPAQPAQKTEPPKLEPPSKLIYAYSMFMLYLF